MPLKKLFVWNGSFEIVNGNFEIRKENFMKRKSQLWVGSRMAEVLYAT
jgi:hypothetical protein